METSPHAAAAALQGPCSLGEYRRKKAEAGSKIKEEQLRLESQRHISACPSSAIAASRSYAEVLNQGRGFAGPDSQRCSDDSLASSLVMESVPRHSKTHSKSLVPSYLSSSGYCKERRSEFPGRWLQKEDSEIDGSLLFEDFRDRQKITSSKSPEFQIS
jgi:hypothetical protein